MVGEGGLAMLAGQQLKGVRDQAEIGTCGVVAERNGGQVVAQQQVFQILAAVVVEEVGVVNAPVEEVARQSSLGWR